MESRGVCWGMSLPPSASSFIMMLLCAEVTPSLLCLPLIPGLPTFLIACYHGDATTSPPILFPHAWIWGWGEVELRAPFTGYKDHFAGLA